MQHMRALVLMLLAVEPAPAPVAPTFARDVQPLVQRWCVRCHGPREQHGGLRLDSYPAIMRGGDSGPAVIPGDPTSSLIVAKVERRDRPPMPPRRALPRSAIARLRAWIGDGARP
jgi:hypothetical protein